MMTITAHYKVLCIVSQDKTPSKKVSGFISLETGEKQEFYII